MEKKVFRVGSVGIGGISRGVHLPGIHKSPDLELVAVCDLKPERMEYARNTYGIREDHCFADYHDLIACPDVDVIDISTSNNAHFEVAKAAIEAGKPFCLEKPVTLTAEEADILAKAAQEKGIPNMVCFSYRFKAAARYAKELVEKGMLVDIYRKAVGHTDTYVTQRRLEEGEGYGPVDVDDFCHYLMEMDGKTSANFSVTRFAYGRGNYQRMEIYGSKGGLVYSLDVTPGVDELEVCFGYPYDRSGIYTKLPIPQRFQCDQMQSFADILNGCSDGMAATIQDGCRIQHALDVIIRSAEEEKWLPCD